MPGGLEKVVMPSDEQGSSDDCGAGAVSANVDSVLAAAESLRAYCDKQRHEQRLALTMLASNMKLMFNQIDHRCGRSEVCRGNQGVGVSSWDNDIRDFEFYNAISVALPFIDSSKGTIRERYDKSAPDRRDMFRATIIAQYSNVWVERQSKMAMSFWWIFSTIILIAVHAIDKYYHANSAIRIGSYIATAAGGGVLVLVSVYLVDLVRRSKKTYIRDVNRIANQVLCPRITSDQAAIIEQMDVLMQYLRDGGAGSSLSGQGEHRSSDGPINQDCVGGATDGLASAVVHADGCQESILPASVPAISLGDVSVAGQLAGTVANSTGR